MFLGYELFVKKVCFLVFVSMDMLAIVRFPLKMMGQKRLGFIGRTLNVITQCSGVKCLNLASAWGNAVKQSECLRGSTCHLCFR